MDWDKLRIFHKVAEAGSFTHAGEMMHLSQSGISRHIRGLEEALGVTLFHRHARGFIMTEQGELLYEATVAMQKRLDATTVRLKESENVPMGSLRVTTTTGFGTLWLTPRLVRFYEKYPDLNIDLKLSESVLDLPMREADLAIRMKEPSQSNLIRKKLFSGRICLFASKDYIARYGKPQKIDDLRDLRLLGQDQEDPQPMASALLMDELMHHNLPYILKINSYFGVLEGVVNGLGVGLLPDYVLGHHPNLVHVLPELVSREVPVYLAYSEELRHARKVQVFRDFIYNEFRAYNHAFKKNNNNTHADTIFDDKYLAK